MNNTINYSVNQSDDKKRLDVFLSNKIKEFTRTYIKKTIKTGGVFINKEVVFNSSKKVRYKDSISIKFILKDQKKLVPSNIKLNVVYEDEDIIVINKPKGMVVHPGAGNYENTLVNALIHKYKKNLSDINGHLRPGIVHRIDKHTSGLLVVAKNNLSHSNLGKQFSDHSINRKYQCLAWGVIRPLSGKIETLIARNKKNRQLMTVSESSGKKAVTNYKTIKTFNIKDVPRISLIECKLETGRTHQIRVHFKYKGTSLLGDKQYGKKNVKFKKINKDFSKKLNNLEGQALHAQTLEFFHPRNKKWLIFKSPFPSDFKNMLNLLNKLSC